MIKKKIIVTGSSRGIGYKIASNLEEEGHKVLFNGRKASKKKNFIRGNFANPKDALRTINKGIKILKGLDVLICNIGESKSVIPNKENHREWVKMFNQNFFSATNAIESAKKSLIKSGGSIICITSICGNELIKGAPITYSVSKSALNFYIKCISHYLGKEGVRINGVSPGNIYFKGSVWEKKKKKNKKFVKDYLDKNVPINEFGTRDDIASLVNFLVSPKANFINGSIITIDGGQTISI